MVGAGEKGVEAQGSPERAHSSPPAAGIRGAKPGTPVGARSGPYAGPPRVESARAGIPPALEALSGLTDQVSESAANEAGAGPAIRCAGKRTPEAYAARSAEVLAGKAEKMAVNKRVPRPARDSCACSVV